jgi:hypothetical protein
MNYRLQAILILFALTCLSWGCGGRSAPPAQADVVAPAPAPTPQPAGTATYSLEVRSESGTEQMSFSDNSKMTVGTVPIRVQDGRLFVNDNFYGTIKSGDKVLIAADGQVLVNLQPRFPE